MAAFTHYTFLINVQGVKGWLLGQEGQGGMRAKRERQPAGSAEAARESLRSACSTATQAGGHPGAEAPAHQ